MICTGLDEKSSQLRGTSSERGSGAMALDPPAKYTVMVGDSQDS